MSITNSEKAKVHTYRPYQCKCGKIVWGNGGRSSHLRAHERRGEDYGEAPPYNGPKKPKLIY